MSHRGRNRHDTSGRWSESPWRYRDGKYSVKPNVKKHKNNDDSDNIGIIIIVLIVSAIPFLPGIIQWVVN
jgi:hypothetical protein